MNLFRRKQEQEPMPICMEQSPLDLARAAVQAADERLSALRREFLELQERYRLLVDMNGNIIQPLVADDTTRYEISRKLHEHRIARGVALHQFHTALGHWAKVKSTP
jgi:hypothetical protein